MEKRNQPGMLICSRLPMVPSWQ